MADEKALKAEFIDLYESLKIIHKDITEVHVLAHVLSEIAREANSAGYNAAYRKHSTDQAALRIKTRLHEIEKQIDLKIRYLKT
jgi:adenine-specific DNA methylase